MKIYDYIKFRRKETDDERRKNRDKDRLRTYHMISDNASLILKELRELLNNLEDYRKNNYRIVLENSEKRQEEKNKIRKKVVALKFAANIEECKENIVQQKLIFSEIIIDKFDRNKIENQLFLVTTLPSLLIGLQSNIRYNLECVEQYMNEINNNFTVDVLYPRLNALITTVNETITQLSKFDEILKKLD